MMDSETNRFHEYEAELDMLRARVRELEVKAVIADMPMSQVEADLKQQLAASQHYAQRLRSAIGQWDRSDAREGGRKHTSCRSRTYQMSLTPSRHLSTRPTQGGLRVAD